MTTALLLSASLALALQGAPAAKPAAPIAVAPAGASGPSVDVPAELARLTGAGTVAVLFVPDASKLQAMADRIAGLGDAARGALPAPSTLRQLVRQTVRTELEVPLDQPVLWWIDMRVPEGDEPPMGFDNLVMHQAFRIPGATAATEKARAEASKADAKTRVNMPVRARERRANVSVLPGDLVVVSSDGEPTSAPADAQRPSPLLDRMPRGQVCGRIDLGRMLAENADQLRMMSGFAAMAMGGGPRPGADATDDERLEAAMRQAFTEGVGRQVSGLVDALMQLKRASFAVDLQGDELHVWADWSRDLAFPTGLDEATVNTLAARLPAGLGAWFGASSSALDAMYGDRFTIDDVIATLGDTPEQQKAWEAATQRMRAAIAGLEGGLVGGVTLRDGEPVVLASFRVKDAAAFRADLTGAAGEMTRSGLADVKAETTGDRLDWIATPNTARLRQLSAAMGAAPDATEAMLAQAAQPMRLSMTFKGSDVTLAYARGATTPDIASLTTTDTPDLRGKLVQGGWGTADWFATADLRSLLHRTMSAVAAADESANDPQAKASIDKVLAQMKGGAPALVRARQGVQGGTARLSISMNLAEIKALVADIEALDKLAPAKPADDADDDDDDENDGRGDRPAGGSDGGT